jgi:phage terminase large subunit-like protein
MLETPNARVACIGPTYGAARDVQVEGESGLLAVFAKGEIAKYSKSVGELILSNGSRLKLFSGADPERLRGPQHHLLWCDELASWQYARETWDMAQFGLRLGTRPRTIVTTTPKPIPLLKELMKRALDTAEAKDDVVVTRASTFDNSANLPKTQLEQLHRQYGDSYLGQQELHGKIIDDVTGALWRREDIESNRIRMEDAPPMTRIVVGIDPAVSNKSSSDETGIVAVGRGVDGHGYVLMDGSLRGTPDKWARAAASIYRSLKADRVIAEANNGGDMVRFTLQTVDPTLPIKIVHASRGKQTRAEPIAAMYEQNKVHHVGVFSTLEDQLCTWTPFDTKISSPDRLDALVWACTDCLLHGGASSLWVPSFRDDFVPRMLDS